LHALEDLRLVDLRFVDAVVVSPRPPAPISPIVPPLTTDEGAQSRSNRRKERIQNGMQILTQQHDAESDIHFARIFIAGFQGLNHVTYESFGPDSSSGPNYLAEGRSSDNVAFVSNPVAQIHSLSLSNSTQSLNTAAGPSTSKQQQGHYIPQMMEGESPDRSRCPTPPGRQKAKILVIP